MLKKCLDCVKNIKLDKVAVLQVVCCSVQQG
jgi:hypothetical protein